LEHARVEAGLTQSFQGPRARGQGSRKKHLNLSTKIHMYTHRKTQMSTRVPPNMHIWIYTYTYTQTYTQTLY
jgi:hypothetical protein